MGAAGGQALALQLNQTVDILGSLAGRGGFIKVGFAAETQDIERYARDKLARKKLDFIVANDARTALGASDNAVTVFAADGASWTVERQPKPAVAEHIIALVAARMDADQPA